MIGEQIPLPARIVAIANRYDNLCNPTHGRKALNPSAALKVIFAKERHLYDTNLIDRFVKCLGIYPPGTFVLLNNDQVGVVSRSNPRSPLKPQVVVYDPFIERRKAIPVNLHLRPELKIVKDTTPTIYQR